MNTDIYIASLWRNGHLATTINSLLLNPECGTITAVCNNYTDIQIEAIRINTKYNAKVALIKGDNLKGCDERFKFTGMGMSKYISICDDDIIYPPNYLSVLIESVNKYNTIVSCHGRTLKKTKAVNYYKHANRVYHCMRDVNNDVEVDILGAGACLFKRDLLPINNFYKSIKYANMGDIYISYLAKKEGLKIIVIAHKEGWLQHKAIEVGDNYIYDNCKNDCQIQTNFINKLFLGY